MSQNGEGADGASMRVLGLQVLPSRECSAGGGHKLREAVINEARETGEAEGPCEACGQRVRLVKA